MTSLPTAAHTRDSAGLDVPQRARLGRSPAEVEIRNPKQIRIAKNGAMGKREAATFLRKLRAISGGELNLRDAKSAARRRRKSEIRSSKSETNPNCQEWGNGETGNRDASLQAAKKRRGLPRPVYRSVRACRRFSVIANHFRRLLYSFGVSRQYAGAPSGTPGF